MTERERCIRCGQKTVLPRTGAGRTINFRNMPGMLVPMNLAIPTCSRCGQQYLDAETSQRIAAPLAEAYRQSLRHRARLAIDVICRLISQRKLELLLGLSQGYLSRLRAGAGNPSSELVSNLALIANNPAERLAELVDYWNTPDCLVLGTGRCE